nr:MAG TPA: hypothetical protein [Caudoviricetes sp.]
MLKIFSLQRAVSYAFIMFLCDNINMSVGGFFLILSP